MRIAENLCADWFGTLIDHPAERVADKKSLFGRESVNFGGTRLAFHWFFESVIRNHQTAEIGDVFTQSQLALHFESGQNFVIVELIDDAVGFLIKPCAVVRRPPYFQISLCVVLTAFVVETVCDFVTDNAARVAVIERVVRQDVEKRRLQNSGGENDFIKTRIVISVNCRRSHSPARFVNGFADVLPVAVGFKPDGICGIVEIRLARNQ